MARVEEVNLKAGQEVKAGEVLVRLNDTDLKARLEQAKAAVSRAEATRTQAAADEQRYAKLAVAASFVFIAFRYPMYIGIGIFFIILFIVMIVLSAATWRAWVIMGALRSAPAAA